MKISRSNPYLQLLLRMSLVLVVVVAVAVFYHSDADARANETDPVLQAVSQNETGNDGDRTADGNNGIENAQGTAAADPAATGSPVTDPAVTDPSVKDPDTTDKDITDVASNDTPPEADVTDVVTVDGDAAETGTKPGMEYASENDTQEIVNGSAQKAEIKEGASTADADAEKDDPAARLAEYKKTQEYVDSLLVTHPDHYDARVVESARSLPLDSDNDRYLYITGKDKQIYKVGKMPEGFKNDAQTRKHMVTIDVPVWKMKKSGEKYSSYWPITINEKLADSIRCIFSDIYQLDIKFPFNYLTGYSYRKVNGVGLVYSKLMSTHAFGVALDINLGDFDNDYFLGKGNDLRNKNNPYCIPDEVIRIFEDYGWFWGGNYDICADTMHFQYFELGFLQYDSDEPFPILSRDAEGMDPAVIRNLTQRLVKLGYLDKETQNFSKKVDKAVKKFQEDHGLEPDGIVNYATWEPLINLTHYMKYVF